MGRRVVWSLRVADKSVTWFVGKRKQDEERMEVGSVDCYVGGN